MAGGVSVHAVDVSRGVPATGMRVELYGLTPERRLIAEGALQPNGTLDHPVTGGAGIDAGTYEVVFHIGPWLRGQGMDLPEPAFLEDVPFRFAIADVAQHYHLPLKFTPWGYSLFRGA